jgi:hypothetical protein
VAKHVLYNAVVTCNAVTLTDRVKSISWNSGIAKQPAAAMSEAQSYSMPGVQEPDDVTIEFYQDYANSNVYQTLTALYQARTVFTLTAKADSAADSATNPNFTASVFLAKMPFINGSRGDAHMAPVTFAVASAITFDVT